MKTNMASDELWLLARWLVEVVCLKSDGDPGEKRKRFEGLPMAFGDEGSVRERVITSDVGEPSNGFQ